MSPQRRCLDCGVLWGKTHEVWCPSKYAQDEQKRTAKQEYVASLGSSPDAWCDPHYRPTGGPLPVMLTHEDMKRIITTARKRAETMK